MAQKLRIVSLLTNLCIGGDPNRLLSFARSVDRTRFEHTVLVIADPMDATHVALGPMLPRFQAHGIQVESLHEPPRSEQRGSGWAPLHGLREVSAFVRIVRRLRRYFIEHDTDIIDARMSYAVLFGALAGRMAGVPVIMATEYGPGFWRGPVLGLAGQLAYALTDVLVSDSQAKIDEHLDWAWRKRLPARLIANGIFTPQTQRTRAQMCAELGLPAHPGLRVVGQVSRILPSKGHAVLIEAAHQVLQAQPNTVFLLCGFAHSPAFVQQLYARASELGIREQVFILGYPGPVADVWTLIDVHVHASQLDSAPIAIHESLALGLPSVVTRVGGVATQVEDGVTSIVVEPGDAAALATGLLRVLQVPGLAQEMGAAARERHLRLYQSATMARATEALMLEFLNASPRGTVLPVAWS